MLFQKFRREQPAQDMYLIAGLGTPGDRYAHTRHNIGFDALDEMIEAHDISKASQKFKGMYGRGKIAGENVLLVKPLTFMNNSGECIRPMADYFKIDTTERLIVIYDDISLEPGMIRIRAKGSAGGHNGMKSIIQCLGSETFIRIKVGVGAKPDDGDLVNHVLGHFSTEDRKKIDDAIKDVDEAVQLILQGRLDEAMNRYNRRK